MRIKKLTSLIAVGISVATTALAGGVETGYVPNYAGLYIEANAGFAYRPWGSDVTSVIGIAARAGNIEASSQINGGFVFGGDIGYQFNRYLSIEGGWFHLPRVTVETAPGTAFNPAPGGDMTAIRAALSYAALKGSVPVFDNAYLFGKFGAAYTYNRFSTEVASSNTVVANFVTLSSFWNPMFAVGSQYYITPNLSVSSQYAYIPGYRRASVSRTITPDTQLFTVSVGYKLLT